MTEPSEQQLLYRVSRGDQSALGELLARHQRQLYNVSLRMVSNPDDAAEITQDAMLKIIEHISEFNGQSALATWMTRITMNLAISHLRKRKLRLTASLDQAPPTGTDNPGSPLKERIAGDRELSPASRVEKAELVEQIHTALSSLDEEFRAVLVLRDIQEMDYDQVAASLSIPVGTVKSRLFRARLALRQQFSALTGGQHADQASAG